MAERLALVQQWLLVAVAVSLPVEAHHLPHQLLAHLLGILVQPLIQLLEGRSLPVLAAEWALVITVLHLLADALIKVVQAAVQVGP